MSNQFNILAVLLIQFSTTGRTDPNQLRRSARSMESLFHKWSTWDDMMVCLHLEILKVPYLEFLTNPEHVWPLEYCVQTVRILVWAFLSSLKVGEFLSEYSDAEAQYRLFVSESTLYLGMSNSPKNPGQSTSYFHRSNAPHLCISTWRH